MANIKNIVSVGGTIEAALRDEAKKSNNAMTTTTAVAIAPAVTEKVERHVDAQVNAVITNITNREPWYQSRIVIGLIVSLAMKAAAAAGIATDTLDGDDLTTLIIALISVLGDLYAMYGRLVVAKPLGE
jgi:hypothetical protein